MLLHPTPCSYAPQQRVLHATPFVTPFVTPFTKRHAQQQPLSTHPCCTTSNCHPRVVAAASTQPSPPSTEQRLSVTLDTAEAQQSIKFVDVPNRNGQDIVLCEVGPDSAAAASGLRVGQQLLAISDPVRQNEMWQLNDRASFRFVRDAFRMRRWPTIELVVTSEPCLADELQAVLQARSMQTVSSDSDSEGGDFFTGAGVMDAVVVEESVKLVGLVLEKDPNTTIGEQLEKAYRKAQPAISAYQKRRQKRRDYLSEVCVVDALCRIICARGALVGALGYTPTTATRCLGAMMATFLPSWGPLCWGRRC